MKLRRLTVDGRKEFRSWLETRKLGETPAKDLIDSPTLTEQILDITIDTSREFETRFEFGKYLMSLLPESQMKTLLSNKNDGVWDWLTVVYFSQFGRKASKYWHYTVTREGHPPLSYRHLARTTVEMYWQHQDNSRVMLQADMGTWGDMAEQLTSRQDIAYNKGYISAANTLYLDDNKLKTGAASRVRPIKKRKKGELTGKGAVGRLALAVRRLSRTHDTFVLGTDEMIGVLPKEFSKFTKR